MGSRAFLPLALLVLVLPFEPMEPLAVVAGFEVSHLEAAALVLLGAAAAAILHERASLRVPLAGSAAALLFVYLLSSGFAEGSALLPLKFTLRMAAAVTAFLLTSVALSSVPRFDWLFASLALAGTLTAAAALLEVGPGSFVEPLLAPFREHSIEVGGRERVAATFSYPNTAGGFLVLALAPTLYFASREKLRLAASMAALAIFAAVLLTYSRGALLGAAASCAALFGMARFQGKERELLPILSAFALMTAGLFLFEPSFRWRASTEGDRSWYEAEITPSRSTLVVHPGELATTAVRVANVGKLTWGSSGRKPFHLSYRWFEAQGRNVRPLPIEGERTRLESPLPPGNSIDLRATLRAPRERGTYVLIWDMVQEHTTWFSDKVGLGAPVTVFVGESATSAPAASPRAIREAIREKSWRPGRIELWSIALDLFRRNPLLGVGPDNFRWLYGPASGHKSWDTRVFSNSLYLELLATVGLAGFTAFAVLVGRALLGLERLAARGPSPREAAVLAASLSGFLVHGLFDYLLAFTPIYLAVFVLLGASSAALREGTVP